jgi:hypothetical protein
VTIQAFWRMISRMVRHWPAARRNHLSWSWSRRSYAFLCRCKRGQSYKPRNEPGGCTRSEAELVGWRLLPDGWRCPYCTGNTANLDRVFHSREEGEKT